MSLTVGTVGAARVVRVDERGMLDATGSPWSLDWWIRASDRWHLPAREHAVRQTTDARAPIVTTAMRVPGGDAVQRVYGVGGPGGVVVVEIENDSAEPLVVAYVLHGARRAVLHDGEVEVDGGSILLWPRRPSRVAHGGSLLDTLEADGGDARPGQAVFQDRAGRLEAAFLHPLPHRSRLRAALVLAPGEAPALDVRALPGVDAVVRGWDRLLARGLRVEIPDEELAARVRGALCTVLLDVGVTPTADALVALEDWGFDTEVAAAWGRLGMRARRGATRRPARQPTWSEVEAARARGPAAFVATLRQFLVHESGEELALLAELPAAWRDQPFAVHDAPTRVGPVSYAVRWHGTRPALLWDVPAGLRVRAPAFDPGWSSTEPRGEALLSARAVEA